MSRHKQSTKVAVQLSAPYRAYKAKSIKEVIRKALADNLDTVAEHWHIFDSDQEYQRYIYLLDCQNREIISELVPHPGTFVIVPRTRLPSNAFRPTTRYLARRKYTPDFRYICNGVIVYEDYKGYKASTAASLQHTLFARYLIEVEKLDPKEFHFKVVTNVTAKPSAE